MDAFFASVEQRDYPEYRGKPVAVGGAQKRGVVAAASYEARKFGVRSAMPGIIAARKCPELIFVRGHFDVYKSVSKQVMNIFRSYTDLVEPMSLDEAYLDVTENKIGSPSATLIARDIRKRIEEETGLTASAGISFNKFLAKVASDFNKPNGLKLITPDQADEFIRVLPVEKIPGVGKVTAQKMFKLGIKTGEDLMRFQKYELVKLFGKTGVYFYEIIRGEYDSPVIPHRTRKSIGAERTFLDDISDEDQMSAELERVTDILKKRMLKADASGKTVTLKYRYHTFEQHTRSRTVNFNVGGSGSDLLMIARELFDTPIPPSKPVRLIGLSVSNLYSDEPGKTGSQLTLKF